MMDKKVLIVDDEDRILQSITGVLEDEGFQVMTARSGEDAIEVFTRENPDVTLLDIWMPGIDGIEILKRLKWIYPDCQVIMISGHATISTAMTAVKLGAFDFLEKPLSLDILTSTIHRAIDNRREGISVGRSDEILNGESSPNERLIAPGEKLDLSNSFYPYTTHQDPSKNKDQLKRDHSLSFQRTIKRSMVLYGTGLHSGMKTGLLLQPLPPNSGILFGNISSDEFVPAHLDYVEATEFATSLRRGRAIARTIEHLMAVLHAYRITNLMVKMIEEIPIMDGSALEFCKIIEEAGVEDQEEKLEELVITRRIEFSHKKKSIVIEPSRTFSIIFYLDYPFPIGKQTLEFTLENEDVFKTQIAPARTFGFIKDVEMLNRMGMGGGGRLHNFILVDDEKIVNTELRFPDEFVRHKILDLIGDLYLLNRPIRGRVIAHFTGHTENIALLRKIRAELKK
jgi:UDP-3-O-acyl N-acetylglucosamine deacetylase